jgi:hypothetical protein
MILKRIIIIFIIIIFFVKGINSVGLPNEYFYSPTTSGEVSMADPLELDKDVIVDPCNWKWDSGNVITTIINIKAIKGQINFQDIMTVPNLGFYQNSGLEYTSVNKLQGTNGWFYLNQSRHGHGWFWWQPTVHWQNQTDEAKRTELEIRLIVTNSKTKPEFPVSFGLKIPDFNYERSVRVWLTLTHNPIDYMSSSCNISDTSLLNVPASSYKLLPPLLLQHSNISIGNNLWKIYNNVAQVNVPISIQQGGIDWTNITGNYKDSSNTWFSWTSNYDSHLHSPTEITIQCTANSFYKPPSFPVYYTIKIKDKNMKRFIYVKLKVLDNPFTYEYDKPTTFKQQSRTCTQKCIT